MSYLTLNHIRKQFGTSVAVQDFNLSAEKGEFISFLGPSGCGKTTTLRMIAGFEPPTSGEILLQGKNITHTPANKRNVGMVFQAYALFPNMTVADNIGFGLKIAGTPKSDIQQRVNEMLELIHLPDFGNRYPQQLSGGQQQRVALARALAFRPQVLLLDEPLSALDAKIRVDLRGEIRRIQRQLNITTIYVTHDQEEALSMSDRIVVMNKAIVEQIGTPFEIYNYPATDFTARFVGQLNQLKCVVRNAQTGECEISGQAIRTQTTIAKPNGSEIRLAIRPEEIYFGKKEGLNVLSGVIDEVNFLGAIVRIRLLIGNQHITGDLFNERTFIPPSIGTPAEFSFSPEACWIAEK
ncbi:MAG TPA: ABC transporter ATP-binding protein [Anaerolineales bacterium]|nr:ABC transporter ATP-binding protein [Anaerolineales bacterium]